MKVLIRPAFNRDGYHLWVLRDDGDKYRIAKPFQIEFGEQTEGHFFELPEPTMFIGHRDWNSLKASFNSEAIANGLSQDPVKLMGELEATKKHLADLQKMIFDSASWSKR